MPLVTKAPVTATVIAVAGALALLATACSSSSSTSPSASPPSATAVATSSSSPAGTASAADGALALLTAQQIASKATADFKAASSVHAAGTMSGEKLDLTIAPGKCAGTITTSAGSLKVIQIGSTVWIDAGGGEYLKTTDRNSQYEGMLGVCTIAAIAQDFSAGGAALAKGPAAQVDGQQAIQLTVQGTAETSYVSDTSTPEYLRADLSFMKMDFSGYNSAVSIAAPPISDVIG